MNNVTRLPISDDTTSTPEPKTHLVKRAPNVKSLRAILSRNKRIMRTLQQEKALMEEIIRTTKEMYELTSEVADMAETNHLCRYVRERK